MPIHTVTAFFDTSDHAENALARLREVGITDANLRVSPQAESSPAPQEPETGFWAFLREVFGAAPEYPSYREGLRRGGIMVVAHVDDMRLDRACDILDEHGSVDLDARTQQWRQEGWSEPSAASRAAQTFTSDIDGGSALAGAPGEPAATRAVNRGRVRIHTFNATTPAQDRGEPAEGAETFGERMDEEFGRTATGGAAYGFTTRLSENMEVLGADGQHVGVIDHIEGTSVELKKDDPAAHGEHHLIPLEWIASVDQAARLKLSAADAWSRWTAA